MLTDAELEALLSLRSESDDDEDEKEDDDDEDEEEDTDDDETLEEVSAFDFDLLGCLFRVQFSPALIVNPFLSPSRLSVSVVCIKIEDENGDDEDDDVRDRFISCRGFFFLDLPNVPNFPFHRLPFLGSSISGGEVRIGGGVSTTGGESLFWLSSSTLQSEESSESTVGAFIPDASNPDLTSTTNPALTFKLNGASAIDSECIETLSMAML